jgi:hypothetical protein
LLLLEKRTCRNLYYLFYTRTRHPTFLYSAPHFFVLGTPLFVLGTPLFVLGTPLLAGEAHRLAVEELSPARLVSCPRFVLGTPLIFSTGREEEFAKSLYTNDLAGKGGFRPLARRGTGGFLRY